MADSKTAIVTGAGTGIGKAVAIALLQDGWNTVVHGPPPGAARRGGRVGRRDRGEGAGRRLPTSPRPARSTACSRRPSRQFGRVDLLFNNAGCGFKSTLIDEIAGRGLERGRRRQSDRFVPVRTRGVPRHAQAAAPRAGASSTTARSRRMRRARARSPYTATKHAITGLTKTLALDGRPFDIACGQIDIGNALTDMAAPMTVGVPQADGTIAPRRRWTSSASPSAVRLHGRPAARRQRAVHDGDGDEDAVRGEG